MNRYTKGPDSKRPRLMRLVSLFRCVAFALVITIISLPLQRAKGSEITIRMEEGTRVVLVVTGETGVPYDVQFTDALASPPGWCSLTNIIATRSPTEMFDPTPGDLAHRFYRIATVPNPDPATLVWIPPGAFTMGSPSPNPDGYKDETPETRVVISRGFWMSKFEVTQGQFETLMGFNPSVFPGAGDLPADSVAWDEARAFCAALDQRERAAGRIPAGFTYRLPSEAEWEYAARAGTTSRFSFGASDSLLAEYGWYSGNSSGSTHSVGKKLANPWGLYDMHGNIAEWCMDLYVNRLPGGTVVDPGGPATGRVGHVCRGGGWLFEAKKCRSARRLNTLGTNERHAVGFRVVLAREL